MQYEDFNEIKKAYAVFSKKYKLPEFDKLNEDFEIGKLENDGGVFLRAVRKIMMEKVINSLGFLEMLLNPMNAPRMYLPYLKSLSSDDKLKIEKIYSQLAELSLLALELEIEYSEKKEADLINSLFKKWNELKPDFAKIVENIRKPNNSFGKKEKSYFS